MSYKCNADYDVPCRIRNRCEIGEKCRTRHCPFLLESYNIDPCHCRSVCSPLIYEEGQTRHWVLDEGRRWTVECTGVVGYVVRCPDCGTFSPPFPTPAEAVAAWNRG